MTFRTFTTSRQGTSKRALFAALGMVLPVTQSLNPPERRRQMVAEHAPGLASQAVMLWEATRRRILTLDEASNLLDLAEVAMERNAKRLGAAAIIFDRFA